MRNPNRIDPLIEKLRAFWLANPDLRLGQIIYNCLPDGETDAFYVEDAELEKGLVRLFNYQK